MPTYLQTSGPISLDDIDAVFGYGTDLNSYRGQTWNKENGTSGTFSTSNLDFAEFYGTGLQPPYSVQYYDTPSGWDSNNLTTYTIPASWGTATSTRRVVVTVVAKQTSTGSASVFLNSATIGGVSATIDAQQTTTGTQYPYVAIISAIVSTSSANGNVVLTFNKTAGGVGISVYNVLGLSVGPYLGTGVQNTNVSSLTTNAGTFGDGIQKPTIAIAGTENNNATVSYSGAMSGYDYRFTGLGENAYGVKGAVGTTNSVTASYGSTVTVAVLACAIYK